MEYHSGGSLPLLGRPRYCPGANANGGYLCETGHCCGETGCCTYYYELWWFWLLWTVLILFSCCCAYRHRRAKQRVQQQQRQRDISLLAYHGASSYPPSMLDLSFLASLKLPSYEEVAAQPSTPPPPYSSVFTTPRYPQPPRTADPHLLTQHGPLLHRPLSDGPSSLSSDNSSSCSCDSCCPSSPCSSSLSAPVTYETDTSHATTPSEATPLALDVTMETISAAATCLEGNESGFDPEMTVASAVADVDDEDVAGAQAPVASDSSISNQIVTVADVTRAASPHPLPSPSSDASPSGETTHHIKQQLHLAPRPPVLRTRSPSSLSSIQITGIEGLKTSPPPKITSLSGPSIPTCPQSPRSPQSPQSPQSPAPTASLHTASVPSSPASLQPPEIGLTPDPDPDPAPPGLTLVTSPQAKPPAVPDGAPDPILTAEPAPPSFPPRRILDPSPSLVLRPPGLRPDLPQHSECVVVLLPCLDSPAVPAASGSAPPPVLCQPSEMDLLSPLPSNVLAGSGSASGSSSGDGSRSGPLSAAPVLTFLTAAASSSSCPSITIEADSPFAPSHSPPATLSPSSPPSLTSPSFLPPPPTLSPTSLPAPSLLLDPLTALHNSNKGGSSSGHASSLSPSPRASQSPPKQTLFSPCVDVYEPGPPSWEHEEEEQEEEDNDDYEDEDMGADESQYRHRRLTGDSGIEVCRCQVEEEEEEEEGKGEEECRRGGGGGGGERDKKGDGNTALHDSADCPARGQRATGEELTPCDPPTPVTEDGGKVLVVMEMV